MFQKSPPFFPKLGPFVGTDMELGIKILKRDLNYSSKFGQKKGITVIFGFEKLLLNPTKL